MFATIERRVPPFEPVYCALSTGHGRGYPVEHQPNVRRRGCIYRRAALFLDTVRGLDTKDIMDPRCGICIPFSQVPQVHRQVQRAVHFSIPHCRKYVSHLAFSSCVARPELCRRSLTGSPPFFQSLDIKLLLLHDAKSEDAIRNFFNECYELYIKVTSLRHLRAVPDRDIDMVFTSV